MPIRAAVILSAILVFWSVSGDASFAQDSPADSSPLRVAAWSGSVYSHRASGYLCWLTDREGALRMEVVETSGDSRPVASAAETDPLDMLDPLLTRTGNGWTLILGPDDTGTLNAWDREWRRVPRGLAQVVRLVTGAVREHPRRPGFDFADRAGPPAGRAGIPRPAFLGSGSSPEPAEGPWRYQLASLDPEPAEGSPDADFRSRLTARGRGTGGVGEVVSLEWIRAVGGNGPGLQVTSSRRPGTLRLGPVSRRDVKNPEPEVFLPLWPLSQFIESR